MTERDLESIATYEPLALGNLQQEPDTIVGDDLNLEQLAKERQKEEEKIPRPIPMPIAPSRRNRGGVRHSSSGRVSRARRSLNWLWLETTRARESWSRSSFLVPANLLLFVRAARRSATTLCDPVSSGMAN